MQPQRVASCPWERPGGERPDNGALNRLPRRGKGRADRGLDVATRRQLLWRGQALQVLTLSWNVVGPLVLAIAAW